MTTPEDKRLREIAERATKGPWRGVDYCGTTYIYGADDSIIADDVDENDKAYLLAFDPPTVLSLLDRALAAEAREAALEAESAALTKALTGLTAGGSEFFTRKGERYVADIPACLAYIAKVKSGRHAVLTGAIRAKQEAQARVLGLVEALKESLPFCKDGTPHRCAKLGGSEPGMDRACCRARALLSLAHGGVAGMGASRASRASEGLRPFASDSAAEVGKGE